MGIEVQVHGTASLQPNEPLRNGVAYVRVRDVSLIDIAAPVVAEQVIEGLFASAGRTLTVPFQLSFRPAPGSSYALEAHVSGAGRPEVELGDYLTMQSYPVSTDRDSAAMRLELRRVD